MDRGTLLAQRYRIEAALASGGMGVVYAARQLPLERWVAIKVLKPELLKHGPFLARLRREAHTAASLHHPNIVEVSDLVIEDDLAFLVMELLEGESLGSRISDAAPLPAVEVATIASHVLSALDAAHTAGLVHRDVKPDNIFLARRPDGSSVAKLLDFGLVKLDEVLDSQRLTATNAVLGTWQYMAPEQARGEQADARADLYATGAVMYYALTKKRPYQAAEMEASMFALSPATAPSISAMRSDVPPGLVAIVERALEKDRHRRWQSAREMHEAILHLMGGRSVETAPRAVAISSDSATANSFERFEAISRAIDAVVGPPTVDGRALDSSPPSTMGQEPRTLPRASDALSIATVDGADIQTSAATAIVIDPRGRDAYAPTFEASVAQGHATLPSTDLVSDVDSISLHSVRESAAPAPKFKPPRRVNINPLEDWGESDAFQLRAVKRAELRRYGIYLALGVFVFASGIALGEMIFR